jgi:AcrR family transcriptional regulator
MARPKKATAQDTRTLAIDAADALLHQHGYLGVSMDAIAEAVGIRKASLYHHFPAGKDELILEIANRSSDEGARCFTQALESNGGIRSQLTELARAIIGKRQQDYAVLRDAMRFMASEHQTHIYQEFYNGQFKHLHTALEQAVARGELQTHDTERSTWAFLNLLSEMKLREDETSSEELVEFIVTLMLHGLQHNGL